MGKLIKNHWARLLVLTAAACKLCRHIFCFLMLTMRSCTVHFAGAFEGFFWPKFFFDFATKNFDKAVKPVPILQTINIILALITFAYEWPLKYLAGSAIHQSLTVRILWLPLVSLSASLLYQGMNPALYYLIGLWAYFWAYSEGEVRLRKPSRCCTLFLICIAGHLCRSVDIAEESGQKTSSRKVIMLNITITMLHL